MSRLRPSALLLTTVLSFSINIASAQIPIVEIPGPGCAQEWQFGENGTDYNASASYQVLGFYYPATGPANWTYNAAISLIGDAYQRTVWIDTPDNTDVESQVLPYRGCLSVLGTIPVEQGQTDNGDCTATFVEACVAAMIDAANQQASESAKLVKNASDVCERIVENNIPEACQQYVGNDRKGKDGHSYHSPSSNSLTSYPAVFGNNTYPNGTDSSGCQPSDRKVANRGHLA
ncbi:MAG: hypothetical protein Q9226_002467 [Calogaya cf. arnoldii]